MTGVQTCALPIYAIAAGTNYTKGVRADGVYTNEYADIKVNIPDVVH